jgi:hypothetical protein
MEMGLKSVREQGPFIELRTNAFIIIFSNGVNVSGFPVPARHAGFSES